MSLSVRSRSLAAFALLALGSCVPRLVTTPAPEAGLPSVPRLAGPLNIRVIHPSGDPLPKVDSTFVFGSVGNGSATLTINGAPVEVAPNGAFLAYLPLPANGTYELVARAGTDSARTTVAFRMPPPPAPVTPVPPATPRDTLAEGTPVRPQVPATPAVPEATVFPQPLVGTVTRARDTLSTGERVAFARRGLTGTYVWMLPRGAQVTVLGRRSGQYQLRMGAEPTAFVPDSLVTLGGPAPAAPPALGPVSVRPAAEWVDVVVPADSAAFLVEESGNEVRLTLYGRAPGAGTPRVSDRLISGAAWSAPAPDAARLDLTLAQRPWGFQAFYEGAGDLVLRLRRPPAIDRRDPLRGRRIVIDPGHPPVGATGPTGLTEADANLAVGMRLAERLRERGAQVVMTRTGREAPSGSSSQTVDLAYRVNVAMQSGGELFVALHNNAFPEGINPFANYGTEAYYYHGQSQELAQALNAEIAAVTRIPNLGAKMSDFAVIRQTWMPAVLTESLFMMFPQQEAALRDPGFVDRLAQAHVRGIETFLRSRAGGR